jgi:hypothetical protein
MGALRNLKHERFCQERAADIEPAKAYELAGFKPHRANSFRFERHPRVASRIEELRRARAAAAQAAKVPIDEILAEFGRRGIDRLDEFFDRDASGSLRVRNLRAVPPEVLIALARYLCESLPVKIKIEAL